MSYSFKEYFTIYKEHLQHIEKWKLLMRLVSVYQICDVIIVAGDAITLNIKDDKYLLIYRILAQILIVVLFHLLLIKLQKTKSGLINLITFLKFLTLSICWEELDYYSQINTRIIERFIILLCFLFSLESQILQTISILFNISYSVSRNFYYEDKLDIFLCVKLIILHILLQILLLYIVMNKQHLLNTQLMALSISNKINYTQLNSQRITQPRTVFIDIPVQEHKQEEQPTESIQQDHLNEIILNSLDCGIYIIDKTNKISIINSTLSNIVMKEENLNPKFLSLELQDLGIEEDCLILPKFHRSQDISSFLKFIQTLEVPQLLEQQFEIDSTELQRLTLLSKNIKLQQFLDNLWAFNHLKHTTTRQIIDFSIKIYIKLDGGNNLFLQITLSPILHKQKPLLVLAISELNDETSQSLIKSSDYLIDISQKIKQPLNCTISMLEIIMNTTPEEVKEKYISPALAGCKLLINTANDILDYVQLQRRQKLDLIQLDVQLQEFLSDIVNVVKSQAIFRGLKITLNIKQNVPQFIRTDPNRLRQILINLLVASIQATVHGTIQFIVQKSILITDHIDFNIKVKAQETNFSVLKIIDKTVRYFKSQNLKLKYQDLASLRQYSQSLIISFYLVQCLSSIPFDYNYQRVDDKEEFNFIIKILNLNPKFNQLLSSKRQSALTNQLSFKEHFQNKDKKRFQTLASLSQETIQKLQLEKQQLNIKIIPDEQKIQEQSEESEPSNDDEIISQESKGGLSNRVEQMLKVQPYFFDYVNENKKKSEGVSSQPSQQLTFGGLGRSSIYSSLCFTSGTMQPNDLLDCFEKMEKIKQQKYKSNCQCPKILICETVDLDLYAVSHQLTNLGIIYEYITQKSQIVTTLIKLFNDIQPCCKGLQLLFIAVEEYDEELSVLFNEIKETYAEYKAEPRIIGLIGCMDEEHRILTRKLPFHDYLSKPIMIDALLFILAKWIK